MITSRETGLYYQIDDVQKLPAFFINVVSASDLWMFLSSNGAPAAGRQNADGSIFPYETDDRLHLAGATGPKTLIRPGDGRVWEPFNAGHDNPFTIRRSVSKRTTGDAVLFEEINECLQLSFAYRWEMSEEYGLVRTAEVKNLGGAPVKIELLDGVENIMPHGIQFGLAATSSCLTDAYKVAERPDDGRLAIFSLTTTIGDMTEPAEVLRANVCWYVGGAAKFSLSSRQVASFARGADVTDEVHSVGRKGAFFIARTLELSAGAAEAWQFVLDTRKTQAQIVTLLNEVNQTSVDALHGKIEADIRRGTEELRRIVGAADGFQLTGDGRSDIRHYMNVLYNNMRGGVFIDGYGFDPALFADFVASRNKPLADKNAAFLEKVKTAKDITALHALAFDAGCPDLIRLALEFLPLTFSRRHGDPSRPWNYFNIRVKDDDGNPLYHYEGNWRDIFQNWEAMGLSFPAYLAPIIAKFLNASTVDGFNPYRITHEGIDWEVPAPHDPWAGIGYWGDHQIVYLNKLLEWLEHYAPDALKNLTQGEIFTYADVPYEIMPYEKLLQNSKRTIFFNQERHEQLITRAREMGADGKLLMTNGQLWRVSLLEKLLVPVLSKLSNLVIGGGIWMNAQRPEWNDANNAIVGNGLSMVTVYQLYRHLHHVMKLAEAVGADAAVSTEVKEWFDGVAAVLNKRGSLSPRAFLDEVGEAFSGYRTRVYGRGFSGKVALPLAEVLAFCRTAIAALSETIDANKRPDGLYHSYNILTLTDGGLEVEPMFLMLEGQTAVLGSGRLDPSEALQLVQTMENSGLMNDKLRQFFLYPVKKLHTFIERNVIPEAAAMASPLITRLLDEKHEGIVLRDDAGRVRFHHNMRQSFDLDAAIQQVNAAPADVKQLHEIYEEVFAHKQHTGRSGIMYKYEGIGCIYWHQNAKFMLSLQEIFTRAAMEGADASALTPLKDAYYRLQGGFGFRHDPETWGAFPLEPHSHTPYDMPAQQPGMTGQVKEDILTRMAELGVQVQNGLLSFVPTLLNKSEFLTQPADFRFIDVQGEARTIALGAGSLAFTICQVPIVYTLGAANGVVISHADGKVDTTLTAAHSQAIFGRTGQVAKIEVVLS